jgi:hypothetical protein
MTTRKSGKGGRPCSICSHPEVGAIDRMLAKEKCSKEVVAVRFDVGPSSVGRHRRDHLDIRSTHKPSNPSRSRAVLSQTHTTQGKSGRFDSDDGRCTTCGQLTAESGNTLDPTQIVRRAERLLNIGERIAIQAEADQDSRLALMAVDRCQKSIDTLARIAGLLKPETVIDNRSITLFPGADKEYIQAALVEIRAKIEQQRALQSQEIEGTVKALPNGIQEGSDCAAGVG